MKLTTILLLIGTLQFFAKGVYSQYTDLTLNLGETNVGQILTEIENQSEFFFLFNQKLVNTEREVNIRLSEKKIGEILDEVFSETDIDYVVMNKQIVLSPREYLAEVKAALLAENQLQTTTITGKVLDETGAPLPGVSIKIKGTTRGSVTNLEGEFTIQIQDPSTAVLVFSFVGYLAQEISIGDQTTIDITMDPDVVGLEEVIIVGYGTQKKVNLTGSVATVSATELVKRSVPNVENLLQGKVTGLQVVQQSGQPGDDDAVMHIRGMGTFSSAGNNPLILVDGIQGSLQDLNPENIESVSVLKDAASSAIYGARAANGVILVTTKRGTPGTMNIEYNGNIQLTEATRLPDFVTNSADFMEYWNYANQRAGMVDYFTQADIDAFRNATDRVKYPNFDWVDFMFHTAQAQNHHLALYGGTEKTTYNFSLGYLDQDGIIDGHKYQRYNMRLSVDSKVNEIVTFGAKVALIYKDRKEPAFHHSAIMLQTYGAGPNYTPYLSDGSGRYSARYNAEAWHNRNPHAEANNGSREWDNYSVATQGYVDVKIIQGLTWRTKGAVNFDNDFLKTHEYPIDHYYFKDNSYAHNGWPHGTMGIVDENDQSVLYTFYSTLNYTKSFSNHNVNVLFGYNQESYFYRRLAGSRVNFPTYDIKELDAGSSSVQNVSGTSNEWAIRSLFGRVNYDYMGKYLVEANFRYDGTSRIYKDNRWGLFPSVSAGWRLSEEQFLNNVSWIDNLKLRASWGTLGNQNIGLYPYQEILSITSYPFSTLYQGVKPTRMTDKNLKWETTTVTDFGVDLSVKNGLFSLTADWFNKVTDDILYAIQIPASIGLSSPIVNYASMKNTGFEFEVGHTNQVGDLRYGVNLNLTAIKNEVNKVKAPSYGRLTTIQEGLPWNSYYLTEWIGIFQSQADIDASATHLYAPLPGDLKFKDQNEDGVINAEDRIVVDGAFPKFYYGGSFNLSWKNLDLTAFLQGVDGQKFHVTNWGIDPFQQGTAPTKELAENAWTPENPTNEYPAMYRSNYKPVTGTKSTYHLKDASYLRLKNLVIGYSIPRNITQKIRMKALRVYISADNLFTITNYPGADPERTGSGRFANALPQLRIYTAGVKVKF